MSTTTTNYSLIKPELTDQVSQTIVTDMGATFDIIDAQLKLAQNHRESTSAHTSAHITYTGNVIGADDVKEALDDLQTQVTSITVGAGTSPAEVVAARAGVNGESNSTLKERLDRMERNIGDIVTISTDTSLTKDQRGVVRTNTASGNVTLTLPATAVTEVVKFTITKTTSDSNLVIIEGNGSDTISNSDEVILSSYYQSVTLISNGINWDIISEKQTYKVNVRNYGARGDGSTSDSTAIANALSDLASGGILYFPYGTYLLSGNFNLTSYPGITLEFEAGASIDEVSYTVTGSDTRIIAEIDKIFAGTGTFAGTWDVVAIFPEWMNCTCDGSADDSTEFGKAILLASLSTGKKVQLLDKEYSISNVSMLSNVTIEGIEDESIFNVRSKYYNEPTPGNYDIGNYNVFKGTSLTNIKFKNIVIKGAYQVAWGNQTINAIGSYNSETLIALFNCTDVLLDRVKLKNTFSSYPNVSISWEDQLANQIYSKNQIKFSGCDNVSLLRCEWKDSCGEAWQFWDCENIEIIDSDFIVNYCVSQVDLTYCDKATVSGCKFIRSLTSNEGNLLNCCSKNVDIHDNYIENGEIDHGNEYLSINSILGQSFLLENVKVHDNIVVNGSIVQATTNGTTTLTYTQEDVHIYNNDIQIDLDTLPHYDGTVAEVIAISLAPYKNQKDILVENNVIKLKGTLLYTSTQNKFILMSFRKYTSGLVTENLTIKNNKIHIDLTSYDQSKLNAVQGNLYFDYGEWIDLTIEGNEIYSPLGSQFLNYEDFTNLVIKRNKHIGGRNFINFPWSDTTSNFDKVDISDNEFEMLEDSLSHTSAMLTTYGYGYFINMVHGRITDMTDFKINNNVVSSAGFVYISNAQTSSDIDNTISLANNIVNYVDITIGSGTLYGLRLGRVNSSNTYSNYSILRNEFYSNHATQILFESYEWKRFRFEGNSMEGDYAILISTDDVSGESDSIFSWKDNNGIDTGSSSITRNNSNTAVVERVKNNNGFLDIFKTALVWNPASLADGAGETSSGITVTGASFGDAVLVGIPYDLQGMVCTGYIDSANTVKIRIQNETGGTIDLASGTWFVTVLK